MSLIENRYFYEAILIPSCSSRALSTFPVTQEAPLSASLSPSAAPAAKIEEKTLSNGVKLIARTGASKVSWYNGNLLET